MSKPEEPIRVTYEFALEAGAESETNARRTARAMAIEQSVEVPEGCFPEEFERSVVGQAEDVERVDGVLWRATISYSAALVGEELGQILNVLFGNLSMMSGVRVVEVEWPATLPASLGGPRFGIEGLRELCGAGERRPLLCTSVKPVGHSSAELAERCRQFALGGLDILKDDHSLANQAWAPFAERVERCQAAVEQANRESGGSTQYFPHLTGPLEELGERVEWIRSHGCRGVLVTPLTLGLDTVRWLARRSDLGLAVFGHPSFAGALYQGDHGFTAEIWLGQILRLIGCDGVIYPNTGGRFPISEETCLRVNERLRGPLGVCKPSFPVMGGGIHAERLGHWIDLYGADTIFLLGSSLYAQGDLRRASETLVAALAQSQL